MYLECVFIKTLTNNYFIRNQARQEICHEGHEGHLCKICLGLGKILKDWPFSVICGIQARVAVPTLTNPCNNLEK